MMKRISADSIHSLVSFDGKAAKQLLSAHAVNTNVLEPGIYIACTYDNEWYVGNIVERSEINQDVLVNCMKRAGKSFSWPRREDTCWIPFQHVLCTVEAPTLKSHGARNYQLSDTDFTKIVTVFKQK